jgi:CubicO group peptidase (beta-lactamase class C family)
MSSPLAISGTCAPGFSAVRDAFAANFEAGREVGASFAAVLDGALLVDLWGGHADAARTRPWQRDTLVNVFSTTKAPAALAIHLLASRGALDLDAPLRATGRSSRRAASRRSRSASSSTTRPASPRCAPRCPGRRSTTGPA